MICTACGSENLPSASFCASCGGPLKKGGTLAPAAEAKVRQRPGPGPMLFVCPHCGRPMRPAPYFGRGVNIAKALLLMIPFNFVGPVLFFLLRKDRFICSQCSRVLKDDASMPLLQTSAQGGLAVWDPEEDQAALQWQSRRHRARARSWGAVSVGMSGIGVALGVAGDPHTAVPFVLAAVPLGIAAVVSAIRSRSLGLQAAAKRAHEQRARVLDLARASGGQLNVSLVAAELRIELGDAESLLSSMVDGHRVDMEVDDNGRISYVFTELKGP